MRRLKRWRGACWSLTAPPLSSSSVALAAPWFSMAKQWLRFRPTGRRRSGRSDRATTSSRTSPIIGFNTIAHASKARTWPRRPPLSIVRVVRLQLRSRLLLLIPHRSSSRHATQRVGARPSTWQAHFLPWRSCGRARGGGANFSTLVLGGFSPYHDVGLGSAEDVVSVDLEAVERTDLVFAICDGLDSGTIYEIGFARALDKPVVVYCENEGEENLKMMAGSECCLVTDYVSAIYETLWLAATL